MKPEKDTRLDVLNNCLSILQGTNKENFKTTFQNAIDSIGSYPKPTEKNAKPETEPTPAVLGAYLYVSNARNVLKLGILEYFTVSKAKKATVLNLENAIKLL